LTACLGSGENLAVVRPPADRLVCDEEPGRPAGEGPEYTTAEGETRRRVTEAVRYKQDLRAAGQSCRDDVNWLRDWFANLPK
jgi:hypothetical protein